NDRPVLVYDQTFERWTLKVTFRFRIGFGQRHIGKPQTYIPSIGRVYVGGIVYKVRYDHHAGSRQFKRSGLLLPYECTDIMLVISERSDLHIVKRELPAPSFPPALDHFRK